MDQRLLDLTASPHHLTTYDSKLHFHTSPALENLIGTFRGERALDLGCGDGRGSDWLHSLGLEQLELDILDSARNQVRGDGQRLPFRDSTFCVVLSLKVLEHVRAPSLFLEEVHRVLKPGSLFLGSVAFLEPYHDQSYFHFSPLALAEYLVEAGFDVAELQPGRSALSSLFSTALPTPNSGHFPPIAKLLGGLLQKWLLSIRRVSGFAYARLTGQSDRLWRIRQVDDLRFAGEFSFLAIRR